MDHRVWLFLFILLTLLSSAFTKRNLMVDLQSFSCIVREPSYCSTYSCTIYRNRPNPVIYASFILLKPAMSFDINVSVDFVKSDKTNIKIARCKLDGCQFLRGFYVNNIYGKLFKRMQQASNLPRKCPIVKNQLYEIRNYTILANEFPPVVPEMTYNITLNIMIGDVLFADAYVIASLAH